MTAKEYLEYRIDNDYGGTELGDTLWDNKSVIAEFLESYAQSKLKEKKGLDLDELERKLDEALDKETPESLTKWLNEQRNS